MTKKSFIIILILSVVLWFASRVIQTFIMFVLTPGPAISFSASECSATGYPLAICDDANKYVYYLINIAFWFIIILLFKNKFKFIKK